MYRIGKEIWIRIAAIVTVILWAGLVRYGYFVPSLIALFLFMLTLSIMFRLEWRKKLTMAKICVLIFPVALGVLLTFGILNANAFPNWAYILFFAYLLVSIIILSYLEEKDN